MVQKCACLCLSTLVTKSKSTLAMVHMLNVYVSNLIVNKNKGDSPSGESPFFVDIMESKVLDVLVY